MSETLLWLLVLPAMIGLWLAVFWCIAQLGGWSRLAATYQMDTSFPAEYRRFRSMSMGGANYSNAITAAVDQEHLYLRLSPVFAIAHPPLKIPFRALQGRALTDQRGYDVMLTLKCASKTMTLKVTADVANAMEYASGGAWSYERV